MIMEKINITELLRNCPQGMELDCTCADNVIFDKIIEYEQIKCVIGECRDPLILDKYGRLLHICCPKCVIFPKGKTTWEGFQKPFKDGDIVVDDIFPFIYKNCDKTKIVKSYCGIDYQGNFWKASNRWTTLDKVKFATEEQKEKLFNAIKDNGYSWNPETKKLVKLKFKVGDTIKNKNDKWLANRTIQTYVVGIGYFTTINDWVRIDDQDNWELVSDIEPKFKVGNKIKHKCDKNNTVITITGSKNDYYYIQYYNNIKNEYQNEKISFTDQDKYELIIDKFDISTLIPFESKVLVRSGDSLSEWKPAIFGIYRSKYNNFYAVGGTCWKHCIPYEGNEHLLGTTNDCEDYFKTWQK